MFEQLNPEEIVAILSAFVFQQRNSEEVTVSQRMDEAAENIVRIANGVATIQLESGVPLDPTEWIAERLNFGMMDVVYEWAKGTSFSDICKISLVAEGTIVRCITRLDETCREVRNIARVIGDASLFAKMETASEMIKRDIVFASSLYIS